FPLTYLTAWHMLMTLGGFKSGQDALILAASSGVSTAAIQIARLANARTVVAVTSDARKADRIKALGADHVIIAEKPGILHRSLRKACPSGADVVIEHLGGAWLMDCVRSVKPGGSIINCGATAGFDAAIDVRYFFSKEISFKGALMGTLEELRLITAHVAAGRLKPVIDSVMDLQDVRKAHEKMQSRELFGKIVIRG
ncbi:MAG: zinc-binding dehydrogenase, partial [Elusimicrobiota bacterium]